MLENVFRAVLITSLIGTISTMGITLIKPLTKRYFSSGWHYYIWIVVLITMIVPFRFIIPEKDYVANVQENNTREINYIEDNPVLEFVKNDKVLPDVEKETIFKRDNIVTYADNKMHILSVIWLAVAITFFLFNVLAYSIFVSKIKKESKVTSCQELKMYTDKKIITRTSNSVSSPLILGIIRPTLILPEFSMTSEQLSSVLFHEMTHFKRNDILYKWFLNMVKCIHWFNPVVYYIAKQVNIECEISCDLAVVKGMDKEQEKNYINTILTLATAKKNRITFVTTAMAEDKKTLKMRFSMIKNRDIKSKRAITISVIIAIAIFVGTAFASGILNGKFITNYENEMLAVETDARQGDDFTFLLLGLDEQDRADTIMILSAKDGELIGISIPREVMFIIDGIKARANEILAAENGDQKLIDVIKETMSMPINYYAKVDLPAVASLIDSVGGIEVDVPIDMEYSDPEQNLTIKLKQGRHTLNGSSVCGLLQFRRSNNGNGYNDVTRIGVGQQVIKEFISQKLDNEFINQAPKIFRTVFENVETNYPISNLAKDIKLIDELKTGLTFKTISGTSIIDDTGFVLYEAENGEIISAVSKPNPVSVAHDESKARPEIRAKLKMPCEGTISNHFGKRVHPITNEVHEHNGIDIKAPEGTDVVSSINGTVTDVGYDDEKGNYIVVEKDNVKTIYSQLSATNVKKGDKVSINQSVGAVGSTGNSTGAHLHFEVMVDGEYVDPESLTQ